MSYLEELLPEFRKRAKIRQPNWAQGEYIYLDKNGVVYDERNTPFDFTNEELFSEWELYQEPIDWDYIIKNKCLCWFWDMGDEEESKKAGILAYYDYDNSQFRRYGGDKYAATWFDNCRPVCRDEVTFYEDKKDQEKRNEDKINNIAESLKNRINDIVIEQNEE